MAVDALNGPWGCPAFGEAPYFGVAALGPEVAAALAVALGAALGFGDCDLAAAWQERKAQAPQRKNDPPNFSLVEDS